MLDHLDPRTRDFYRRAMSTITEAGIPFLVGGAYALARYTGIARHTKDFDLFVRPSDAPSVLDLFGRGGYRVEMTHPHWLGKVYSDDAFVDVIFRSGNGVIEVDDEWFEHAVADEVLDRPAGLCPPEEILWTKGYVMERERFDGADMAHLLLARAQDLDWRRLLRRYGPDWRVLLAHLVLFGFVYPSERERIPGWVMSFLLGRLGEEGGQPTPGDRVCQGTLLSRSQYLFDLNHSGFADARLGPRGHMTEEQILHWTRSIEVDGSI